MVKERILVEKQSENFWAVVIGVIIFTLIISQKLIVSSSYLPMQLAK